MTDIGGADVRGPLADRFDEILTPEALALVADLQRRFGPRRAELLAARAVRREEIGRTGSIGFREETRDVCEDGSWRVASAPADLLDRRVEITGPTEAKMLINAWNSGARIHLADFEDANAPTWDNLVRGQLNLLDANRRRLAFTGPDGREYALAEKTAIPLVRPRGWHLAERHVLVDGEPVSGSLFDLALYLVHNARYLLDHGSGPYFYLPKLESHLEARLWNDVFVAAQEAVGVPRGSIRATALIETITAAYEMHEILFELREHASGLNAGRWDYLFSIIKNFRDAGPQFTLPDRNAVTMTAPFMRAYTELLVSTCHQRGAFAIGGMAAFIPSRRDPEVNAAALAKVRADKEREANDGFDGSWVAHPDLVPVATEVFDAVLGDRPNQLDRLREDVSIKGPELLDVAATPGAATVAGLRNNVSVALQYLAAWLGGNGAVAIFNLMEDAATAEIARSQVWQWRHNDVRLDDGSTVTTELVRQVVEEEYAALQQGLGEGFDEPRFARARALFEAVALADAYPDFLTLPAYEQLD
jgi:malate synthase